LLDVDDSPGADSNQEVRRDLSHSAPTHRGPTAPAITAPSDEDQGSNTVLDRLPLHPENPAATGQTPAREQTQHHEFVLTSLPLDA